MRGGGRSVISGTANHQTSRCPFRNSSQPSHFSGMKRGPLVQTPSLPFPPNLALSVSARRAPTPHPLTPRARNDQRSAFSLPSPPNTTPTFSALPPPPTPALRRRRASLPLPPAAAVSWQSGSPGHSDFGGGVVKMGGTSGGFLPFLP